MLTNEVYAGTLVWGRNSKRGLEPVRIENAFLAIVDKVTFDKVRDQLVKQKPGKPGPRKTATRSFISDDPRLGHCGESPSDQDTGNGQFPYCACNTLNKEVVGPCLAKYLNSFNIDNCVVNNTKEHILSPKNSNRPVDPVNEEIDNPSISYRDELVGISDEITNIKHHLEHLCASVEHFRNDLKKPIPIIDERECYQENCPTPKARIDSSLSDKCTGMAVSEMVRSFADDPDNSLIRNSLVDRKTFIQGFIKDVKVNGDEVMLTYIIPLSSARISEENTNVLSN